MHRLAFMCLTGMLTSLVACHQAPPQQSSLEANSTEATSTEIASANVTVDKTRYTLKESDIGPVPDRSEYVDFSQEVIYGIMVDRFANGDPSNDSAPGTRLGDEKDLTNPIGWHGGDFAGITQKIKEGYFESLGITTLWLMPLVEQMPGIGYGGGPNEEFRYTSYHGYTGDDFFNTEPHFGTMAELKALVDTAHANELKVVIDVVTNYAGRASTLVDAYPDWFRTGDECGPDNDVVTMCFWGDPDFIHTNPEVREFLLNYIQHLANEVNPDGWRLDAMKHVDDIFWEKMLGKGGPADPSKYWSVGEVLNFSVNYLSRFTNEVKAPSVFDFALYQGILQSVAYGGSTQFISSVFENDDIYVDPNQLTTFIDNHDFPRFMTETLNKHENNMAMAHERLYMALSLLYFSRGIPSIYYGTEIAMQGKGDPYWFNLAENNRQDMAFDQVNNTKINGTSIAKRLQALAQARKAYPALTKGETDILHRPEVGCAVDATSDKFNDVFVKPLYLRGAMEGWSDPPRDHTQFTVVANNLYQVALSIPAGSYDFKVAGADWYQDAQFSYVEADIIPNQAVHLETIRSPEGNATLHLEADGCYLFTLDAQSTAERPTLKVTEKSVTENLKDILVFARKIHGKETVYVVINNSNEDFTLTTKDNISFSTAPVSFALKDITALPTQLALEDGQLVGKLPKRSVLALVKQ